jgi:hypothetical protein
MVALSRFQLISIYTAAKAAREGLASPELMKAWADYCAKPAPSVNAGDNIAAIRA